MKGKISIDQSTSKIFQRNVIDWHNDDKNIAFQRIAQMDEHIRKHYNPMIVTSFLHSDDIQKINYFTKLDYEFIQSRLIIEKEILPSSTNLYPYKLVLITNKDMLNQLLNVSKDMIFDDRFTLDPKIDNLHALRRVQYFLQLSFRRKNEYIFLLVNSVRNSILGFRSFSINENNAAKLLLSGILKTEGNNDLNKIINLLELEEYNKLDIRKVNSVISLNNFDEINRYIAEIKYRVVGANMVLRKIY